MAKVTIKKQPKATTSIWTLFDETEKVFEALQKKAYGFFEQRGGLDGFDVEDWLRAERELFMLPPSELIEENNTLRLKAAVPGMKAENVEVTATPREIIIRGKTEAEEKREEEKMYFREMSRKEMFRRYELPADVDVDKITAKLEDGMLTVEMPKAEVKPIPIAEAPAEESRTEAKAA